MHSREAGDGSALVFGRKRISRYGCDAAFWDGSAEEAQDYMAKRNVKIVCAVIAAVIVLIVGVFVFRNLFGKFFGIEKEELKSYQYRCGGDMLGSSYSKSVQEYDDDSALITIQSSEWYGDDGAVKEYLVDREILNELKAVFVKYHMKNWDNKKFTKMFVADGASHSYSFDFETDSVSFSSQIYPEKYSVKLKILDEIVDKYLRDTESLPGLVTEDAANKDDHMPSYDIDSGEIELSVYSYYQKNLCYRVVNGTDEDKELDSAIRLYRAGERVPILEECFEYKTTLYAHRPHEDSLTLNERLLPGKYRLEAFDCEAEFEIGQQERTVVGTKEYGPEETVICPCCSAAVLKAKYCAECGSSLDKIKSAAADENKTEKAEVPAYTESQRKALSDKGLTLLASTCQKTLGTLGGDGYSEIVLYLDETTGEYQLHTYSKYSYMKEEDHDSYTAAPELAEGVMNYIKEHDLASWKDQSGITLCGGDFIIRFKHGDEWIRLDSGNMSDNQKAFTEIDSMLHAGATEENRRYAD